MIIAKEHSQLLEDLAKLIGCSGPTFERKIALGLVEQFSHRSRLCFLLLLQDIISKLCVEARVEALAHHSRLLAESCWLLLLVLVGCLDRVARFPKFKKVALHTSSQNWRNAFVGRESCSV